MHCSFLNAIFLLPCRYRSVSRHLYSLMPRPKTSTQTVRQLKRKEKLRKKELSVRNYVCRFCQKSFTKSVNMRVHERIHTGDRPFLCRFCEKSFTRSVNTQTLLSDIHDLVVVEWHSWPCCFSQNAACFSFLQWLALLGLRELCANFSKTLSIISARISATLPHYLLLAWAPERRSLSWTVDSAAVTVVTKNVEEPRSITVI